MKISVNRRKTWMMVLPLLLGGIGTISVSYLVRSRTLSQMHQMLHSHVGSVTALVTKSVSQGAWSTATVYALYEEQLYTTAHLLSVLEAENQLDSYMLDTEGISVFLPALNKRTVQDRWGNLPEDIRNRFTMEISDAPLNELLETPLLRQLNLICMVFEHDEKTEMQKGVLCHDNTDLTALKHNSGIGPLMEELAKANLSWVVLQDPDGILAAAPRDVAVSRWSDDEVLAQVYLKGQPRVRHMSVNRIPHVEGIAPFEMVDGSVAVIRVAVNASVFSDIQQAVTQRHYSIVVLVAIIEALVIGLGLMYQRWRQKQADIEMTLADREKERKHWELIGGLSATVAHEVRNPLNTISMTGERLRCEFNVPSEQKDDYDHLLLILDREASQLNKIVTDFLELGKPNQLQLEDTDIGMFVDEIVPHFFARAEAENKPIQTEIDANVTVAIDRRRFQQVITNIMTNALDACGEGDSITVSVSNAPDGEVIIRVSDSGIGMTQAQLADALTPFVSFKANGTGLGLALVDRLIRLHKGTLNLRRNEHRGTTVEIRLKKNPN